MTLYDYMRRLIDCKEGTIRTSWRNCEGHLRRYHTSDIRLVAIDRQWVRGFREYLDARACQWDIDGRKRNVEPKPISLGTKGLMFLPVFVESAHILAHVSPSVSYSLISELTEVRIQ